MPHLFHAPSTREDQLRWGSVFVFETNEAQQSVSFEVNIPNADRIAVAYREKMCWMSGGGLKRLSQLPMETQFLLFQCGELHCLLIPLVEGGFRSVFEGLQDDHRINLRIHSDDLNVKSKIFKGFYQSQSKDPYTLIQNAASDICDYLKTVRLRNTKPVPEFSQLFGWCSYNAFYQKVSHEKLVGAIMTFKEAGVTPGFVLIDDGWANQGKTEDGRSLVYSFEADTQKFPQGLRATVKELKALDVRNVLAWTSFAGYWHGANEAGFPEFTFEHRVAKKAEYLDSLQKERNEIRGFEATVGPGFVPPNILALPTSMVTDWENWYKTYCFNLATEGIDGIKIDAMAWIEMFAEGRGGRGKVMKDLIRAVEKAGGSNLNDQVLYCSSCSNDFFLQAETAFVTRTSTDYFPDIPASHGKHIVKNAIVGYFTGEWILPDWDMFQSHKMAGEFHAAARALSGGPVYVADLPSESVVSILKKLAFSDGSLPRCNDIARPTIESLYCNATEGERLFTLFNTTPAGGVTLGTFNCHWDEAHTDKIIESTVALADIPAFDKNGEYLHFFLQSEQAHCAFINTADTINIKLSSLNYQIDHFALVQDGFAAIGLINMYNVGGGIERVERSRQSMVVAVRGAGTMAAYCAQRPGRVSMDNRELKYQYHEADGLLLVEVNAPMEVHIEL